VEKVWSQFKCNDDPDKCNDDPEVIAAAACNGVTHDNQTGAKFLSTPYVKLRRPIAKDRTTLAGAKAYSQLAAVAQGAAEDQFAYTRRR
jgi:hypothetical protein